MEGIESSYTDAHGCPQCVSIQFIEYSYILNSGQHYYRYNCADCGHVVTETFTWNES